MKDKSEERVAAALECLRRIVAEKLAPRAKIIPFPCKALSERRKRSRALRDELAKNKP